MRGSRGQQFQLAGALDVEQQNACLQRLVDLVRQLADAGEDNVPGRFACRRHHPLQLAAGDDIEARAHPRQQPQDRQIRIRFHRVADGVLAAAECFVEAGDSAGG